jgi:hypothetical protein
VKLQAIFEPPATEMKPLTQDFHGPRAIGFTVVTDGVQAYLVEASPVDIYTRSDVFYGGVVQMEMMANPPDHIGSRL